MRSNFQFYQPRSREGPDRVSTKTRGPDERSLCFLGRFSIIIAPEYTGPGSYRRTPHCPRSELRFLISAIDRSGSGVLLMRGKLDFKGGDAGGFLCACSCLLSPCTARSASLSLSNATDLNPRDPPSGCKGETCAQDRSSMMEKVPQIWASVPRCP